MILLLMFCLPFLRTIAFALPLFAMADSAETCYLPLKNASVCPPVSALKLNPRTNEWKTDNDWKSTAGSFSSSVTHFLGAQWKGVQLGYMLCLYQGPNKNEFPIGMHKNVVVESPLMLLDHLDPKGANYKNPWIVKEKKVQTTLDCYSKTNNPCDCPYIQYQEKKESVEDIINSIQQPKEFPPWA
ncbi:MAG TPA: hypothetical protein DCW33_01435 [Proteobacteria bacterium]|nr:hypothetical protein [Pseudomonadota bacterium]|tara:strand:- start:354 stop:908 length:555 start_codon:yes stop_codon:yes gene_type:complete